MKVIGPSHPKPHQKHIVFKMCAVTRAVSTLLEKPIAIASGSCVRTQNRLGTVGAGGFLDATWRRRQFALEPNVDASKDPGRVGQGSQPHQPMEET